MLHLGTFTPDSWLLGHSQLTPAEDEGALLLFLPSSSESSGRQTLNNSSRGYKG